MSNHNRYSFNKFHLSLCFLFKLESNSRPTEFGLQHPESIKKLIDCNLFHLGEKELGDTWAWDFLVDSTGSPH